MAIIEKAIKGFSLIELAISLLILSIALIPVVLLLNGPQSSKVAIEQRTMTQEKAVANSLMESAIANTVEFMDLIDQTKVLQQKNANHEISTQILHYPDSNIYYRWIFKNLTYTGKNNQQVLPDGNYLVDCSLELFKNNINNNNNNPTFVLGTKILIQEPDKTFDEPLIGIMFLIDVTPSMSQALNEFGSCPMHVKTILNQEIKVQENDLPVFREDSQPSEIIEYLSKHCTPKITYGNNFGFPYLYYKDKYDMVFGNYLDDPNTDYDETFFPSISEDIIQGPNLISPYPPSITNSMAIGCFAGLKSATISLEPESNMYYIMNTISKIEMTRSVLLATLYSIEQKNSGDPKYFRIGALPFAYTTKPSYLVPLQSPNKDNKFKKIETFFRSINRDNAPFQYTFPLTTPFPATTDFKGALNLAHKKLLEDKDLTHRMIFIMTDWNQCLELPQLANTNIYRNCIIDMQKQLYQITIRIMKLKAKKEKANPNYKFENDPLSIRLEEITQTLKWLNRSLAEAETEKETGVQILHPLQNPECLTIQEDPALSKLIQEINNGTINSADNKQTDVYVFKLVEANNPPSREIFDKMIGYSENGEAIAYRTVYHYPGGINYIILELDRYLKIAQSRRYPANQRN